VGRLLWILHRKLHVSLLHNRSYHILCLFISLRLIFFWSSQSSEHNSSLFMIISRVLLLCRSVVRIAGYSVWNSFRHLWLLRLFRLFFVFSSSRLI
jgi:hypothetical protein